jgi:anaphase-promoting complex subunit 10
MAISDEAAERDDESEKREIGKLAVWSVSSAKPGNGVDLLRDSNLETYWQ